MNRFLNRFSRFIAGFIALNLILFIFYQFVAIDTRLATTLDKEKRLEETVGLDRIILIGGSNLQYGINSELLSSELNRDVVNMGVQASLGLDFMLSQVKNSITKNDIVILSLEPGLLGAIPTRGESTIIKLFFLRPGLILDHFRPEHIQLFIEDYPVIIKDLMQDCIVSTGRLVFNSPGFRAENNIYGDYLGHERRDRSWKNSNNSNQCYDLSSSNLKVIDEFASYCNNLSIPVYLSWPPIAKSRLGRDCLEVFDNQELLIAELSPIFDMVLEDSMFYDTPHHLRFGYRNLRTEKLIKQFKNN